MKTHSAEKSNKCDVQQTLRLAMRTIVMIISRHVHGPFDLKHFIVFVNNDNDDDDDSFSVSSTILLLCLGPTQVLWY